MKLAAVILAAGYSSRMNGFKPLMALGGVSLLSRCAGLFQTAGIDRILVVSGHRHEEVEAEAKKLAIGCIHNPHYDLGMFSSVCAAIPSLAGIDGFFVLPVDIPLIRPATITALADAFNGYAVVYPCFEGLRGHPPLLPAALLPLLKKHDGQGGLQSFLQNREFLEVAVWDRGILLDADTPADFHALAERLDRMAIGEPAEALALAKLALPERGMAHGLAVASVAVKLGRALNRHGLKLDPDLLSNAALLHDIGKGHRQHETWGGELLGSLGLTGLAAVVAVHRDVKPPSAWQDLSEKEIVCLADKLVRGARRLPVAERFAEKLALFAADQEACRAIRRRLDNALALQTLVEGVVGQRIDDILAEART